MRPAGDNSWSKRNKAKIPKGGNQTKSRRWEKKKKSIPHSQESWGERGGSKNTSVLEKGGERSQKLIQKC